MAKGRKTGGRVKGVPNRLSADAKQMVLDALMAEGGVAYLRKQARENPNGFLSLVRGVIPLQVGPAGDGKSSFEFTWKVTAE